LMLAGPINWSAPSCIALGRVGVPVAEPRCPEQLEKRHMDVRVDR